MDKFKAMSQKEIGIGGIKCPCCSPPRKDRKNLRRRARRRLKAEDKKNNSF